MPDASGTPSVNFGFPKYNTGTDPPSGKGLNTFVDDLDAKLLSRFVQSTDSKGTGEVPVWDGSAFVYTKINSNHMESEAWTTFTPTIEIGSGGNTITVGNGTVTGRYIRHGRLIVFRAGLVFGSTTAGGSGWPGGGAFTGGIILTLPVANQLTADNGTPIGTFTGIDIGVGWLNRTLIMAASDSNRALAYSESSSRFEHNTFVPVSGDQYRWIGYYEAAS